jgi:formate hydrogenlyase subunit 6/NADH:ubiquinone oxidoreductase subunit I
LKLCPKCGIEKPLSDFHNNKSRKDGKCAICKICANNCSTKWIDKNRKRMSDAQRKRRDKYLLESIILELWDLLKITRHQERK